jgi:hypothetical protein
MSKEEKLLNKKGVCDLLNISLGKLDLMIKNKEIKYLKLNKMVRFRLNDIFELIDNKVVENEC